jgi:peroxiredoxin
VGKLPGYLRSFRAGLTALALLIVSMAGAADATKPGVPPRRAGAKAGTRKPAPKPAPKQAVQVEPAKLTMPKVVLSEAHAKTCLVKVGDPLPDMELKDLAGKTQSINSLMGKKLTVVVFWRSDNSYSLEELSDIGPDVAAPYGNKEVAVIAIDEREGAQAVAAVVKKLGATVPVLLDPKGELLAKVSTRRLPRTYLVDEQGKILWFDIEYSNTTRRDLRDAIRVVLNEES